MSLAICVSFWTSYICLVNSLRSGRCPLLWRRPFLLMAQHPQKSWIFHWTWRCYILYYMYFAQKNYTMSNRKTPEKIYKISIFAEVLRWDWIAHSDSLRAEGPRIEYQWGRDFMHPYGPALRPAQPAPDWVPGVFLEGNRTERDVDHPPFSGAEVKGRVELYVYSSSGPSWSIITWTLLNISRIITFL